MAVLGTWSCVSSEFAVESIGLAVRDAARRCGGVAARFDRPGPSRAVVVRLRVKTRAGSARPARARAPRRGRAAGIARLQLCRRATIDDVIAQVGPWSRLCDLAGVEQPFAPGDVADTRRLGARLDVALRPGRGGAVESATSTPHSSLRRRVDRCVKPARVGGLVEARARSSPPPVRFGLAAYVGGFFESPLARGSIATSRPPRRPEPSDVADVPVAWRRRGGALRVGLRRSALASDAGAGHRGEPLASGLTLRPWVHD